MGCFQHQLGGGSSVHCRMSIANEFICSILVQNTSLPSMGTYFHGVSSDTCIQKYLLGYNILSLYFLSYTVTPIDSQAHCHIFSVFMFCITLYKQPPPPIEATQILLHLIFNQLYKENLHPNSTKISLCKSL